jgi:hypothetical protein
LRAQNDRIMKVFPSSPLDPGYRENHAIRQEKLADAFFFALALRNFWRAAEWIGIRLGAQAQEAFRLFTSSVPNAIELRNIVEHFDVYMESKGRIQQSARKRGSEPWGLAWFNAWLQRLPNGEYILKVTDGHSTYKLDIAIATLAAETLARTFLELQRERPLP